MKVLQLIDSLEAGGAERVSVNIAKLRSDYCPAIIIDYAPFWITI